MPEDESGVSSYRAGPLLQLPNLWYYKPGQSS